MKRSLKAKLILSYLAVALLTVLVVSALFRLTSGRSLMNLFASHPPTERRIISLRKVGEDLRTKV